MEILVLDVVDAAKRIVGPWFWACRIGANRKEWCCGLSNAAVSDTKGPSRGGKNWRHSPPRSTQVLFRFYFAMSSIFRFFFVNRCRVFSPLEIARITMVHPAHIGLSSGLCAAPPQLRRPVREALRATAGSAALESCVERSAFA